MSSAAPSPRAPASAPNDTTAALAGIPVRHIRTISPAHVVIMRVDRVIGPEVVPPMTSDRPTASADSPKSTTPARIRRSARIMMSIICTPIKDGMITQSRTPEEDKTFAKAIQLTISKGAKDQAERGRACGGFMTGPPAARTPARSAAGPRRLAGTQAESAQSRRQARGARFP